MINSIWQSSGERVKTIDNNFFTVFHIWNFYQLLFTNKTCSLGFWETLSAFHMISLRGCESGHKIWQKKNSQPLFMYGQTSVILLSFMTFTLNFPAFLRPCLPVCRSAVLINYLLPPFSLERTRHFFFSNGREFALKIEMLIFIIFSEVYKPVFFLILRISLSAKSKKVRAFLFVPPFFTVNINLL